MTLDLLLRLVARLLPPLVRARYLEEWRADLVGAAQLGLPRRGVLLGAVVLVVRIDRDRPEHSGEPRGTLPRRLARRGGGLLVAAAAVLLGRWFTGGPVPGPGAAAAGVTFTLTTAGLVLTALAVLAGLLGAALLVGAGFTARTRLARASLLTLVLGVAVVTTGTGTLAAALGFAVLFAAFIGGVVVLTGTAPLQLVHRRAERRQRVPVAVTGVVLLLAVVVLGGIDLVVWDPMVKAPGRDIASIYALMVERDHFDVGMNFGAVLVWALFWTAAGVVVTVGALVGGTSALTPHRLAVVLLGLVGAAVFCRFFAGFGIGMSLGDTFATGGGDGTLVSALLSAVGQLALAASAIMLGWPPRATPRPALPTA